MARDEEAERVALSLRRGGEVHGHARDEIFRRVRIREDLLDRAANAALEEHHRRGRAGDREEIAATELALFDEIRGGDEATRMLLFGHGLEGFGIEIFILEVAPHLGRIRGIAKNVRLTTAHR